MAEVYVLFLLILLLIVLFVLQIRKLRNQDISLLKKIIFFFSPVKLIAFALLFYGVHLATQKPGYSLLLALYVIPAMLILLIVDHFTSRIKNRQNYYLAQFFIILLLLVAAGSIF